MTFSTLGSLVKENDLETKANSLLGHIIYVQNGKSNTFCAEKDFNQEIEFLIKNEYIVQKKGTLDYLITSKGKEYALEHL